MFNSAHLKQMPATSINHSLFIHHSFIHAFHSVFFLASNIVASFCCCVTQLNTNTRYTYGTRFHVLATRFAMPHLPHYRVLVTLQLLLRFLSSLTTSLVSEIWTRLGTNRLHPYAVPFAPPVPGACASLSYSPSRHYGYRHWPSNPQ